MRRVKNNNVHSNPGLMFAHGVESIVREHLHHPRNQDAQPDSKKQRVAKQKDLSGNFFSLLMRQFASY